MKITQLKSAVVTIVAFGALSAHAQKVSPTVSPAPENAVLESGTLTSANVSDDLAQPTEEPAPGKPGATSSEGPTRPVENPLPQKISPRVEVDPALISAEADRPGRTVNLNLCSVSQPNQQEEASESVQSRSKCAGGPPGSKCGSSHGQSSVKPRPQASASGLQTPETCQGIQQQVSAIRLDPLDTRRQTVEIAFTRDASYVKTVRIEFNSERDAEAYVRNVLTGEINNISGLWDFSSTPQSPQCARQATYCTRSDRVASNRAELHREGTAERGTQPVASNSGSTSK